MPSFVISSSATIQSRPDLRPWCGAAAQYPMLDPATHTMVFGQGWAYPFLCIRFCLSVFVYRFLLRTRSFHANHIAKVLKSSRRLRRR